MEAGARASAAMEPEVDSLTLDTAAPGIEAWEYNHSPADQRLPHKHTPNRPVPLAHLHDLGISTSKPPKVDDEASWEQIKSEHGYKFSECVTVSRECVEDFDALVAGFFKEHMHLHEEARVILDGSGYWDVRDHDQKWIRFAVGRGDMIVLPAGMFHRFTLDENNYIKALLLYKDIPARTQHDRGSPAEECAVRQEYVRELSRKFSEQPNK